MIAGSLPANHQLPPFALNQPAPWHLTRETSLGGFVTVPPRASPGAMLPRRSRYRRCGPAWHSGDRRVWPLRESATSRTGRSRLGATWPPIHRSKAPLAIVRRAGFRRGRFRWRRRARAIPRETTMPIAKLVRPTRNSCRSRRLAALDRPMKNCLIASRRAAGSLARPAGRSRWTRSARGASPGASLAQPMMNSSALGSRSLSPKGEGSIELKSCFNSARRISMTSEFGGIGSPANCRSRGTVHSYWTSPEDRPCRRSHISMQPDEFFGK